MISIILQFWKIKNEINLYVNSPRNRCDEIILIFLIYSKIYSQKHELVGLKTIEKCEFLILLIQNRDKQVIVINYSYKL